MRKRLVHRLILLCLSATLYPAFIFGFTWVHVARSELPGGRHGPLDAYRHALASALVSRSLGTWAVDVVSLVCESKGKDSNIMDRHNNEIGAQIGQRETSLRDIERAVQKAVRAGAANAEGSDSITWLPAKEWPDARLW